MLPLPQRWRSPLLQNAFPDFKSQLTLPHAVHRAVDQTVTCQSAAGVDLDQQSGLVRWCSRGRSLSRCLTECSVRCLAIACHFKMKRLSHARNDSSHRSQVNVTHRLEARSGPGGPLVSTASRVRRCRKGVQDIKDFQMTLMQGTHALAEDRGAVATHASRPDSCRSHRSVLCICITGHWRSCRDSNSRTVLPVCALKQVRVKRWQAKESCCALVCLVHSQAESTKGPVW